MTTSSYIFCAIGVAVITKQVMKVILWLDNPRNRRMRTPLREISSTGEIEQRFRFNQAMGPPGLSSPTAQVEYGQHKTVKVS